MTVIVPYEFHLVEKLVNFLETGYCEALTDKGAYEIVRLAHLLGIDSLDWTIESPKTAADELERKENISKVQDLNEYCKQTIEEKCNQGYLVQGKEGLSKLKSYKCNYCGKTLASVGGLICHGMKKHFTGDAKRVCPYCNDEASRWENLAKHINRRHTPARDFPCYDCNKSFQSRSDLKTHRKSLKHQRAAASVSTG